MPPCKIPPIKVVNRIYCNVNRHQQIPPDRSKKDSLFSSQPFTLLCCNIHILQLSLCGSLPLGSFLGAMTFVLRTFVFAKFVQRDVCPTRNLSYKTFVQHDICPTCVKSAATFVLEDNFHRDVFPTQSLSYATFFPHDVCPTRVKGKTFFPTRV